jgi:hypothetical protein
MSNCSQLHAGTICTIVLLYTIQEISPTSPEGKGPADTPGSLPISFTLAGAAAAYICGTVIWLSTFLHAVASTTILYAHTSAPSFTIYTFSLSFFSREKRSWEALFLFSLKECTFFRLIK